jgi:hypothetical protein
MLYGDLDRNDSAFTDEAKAGDDLRMDFALAESCVCRLRAAAGFL